MSYLDALIFGVRRIFGLGTEAPRRDALDFVGGGVVVSDDAVNKRTTITISGTGRPYIEPIAAVNGSPQTLARKDASVTLVTSGVSAVTLKLPASPLNGETHVVVGDANTSGVHYIRVNGNGRDIVPGQASAIAADTIAITDPSAWIVVVYNQSSDKWHVTDCFVPGGGGATITPWTAAPDGGGNGEFYSPATKTATVRGGGAAGGDGADGAKLVLAGVQNATSLINTDGAGSAFEVDIDGTPYLTMSQGSGVQTRDVTIGQGDCDIALGNVVLAAGYVAIGSANLPTVGALARIKHYAATTTLVAARNGGNTLNVPMIAYNGTSEISYFGDVSVAEGSAGLYGYNVQIGWNSAGGLTVYNGNTEIGYLRAASTDHLDFGLHPASAGNIRGWDTFTIKQRNAANTGDVNTVTCTNSSVIIGDSSAGNIGLYMGANASALMVGGGGVGTGENDGGGVELVRSNGPYYHRWTDTGSPNSQAQRVWTMMAVDRAAASAAQRHITLFGTGGLAHGYTISGPVVIRDVTAGGNEGSLISRWVCFLVTSSPVAGGTVIITDLASGALKDPSGLGGAPDITITNNSGTIRLSWTPPNNTDTFDLQSVLTVTKN